MKIKYTLKSKTISENVQVSKPLTSYGVDFLSFAAKTFYEHSGKASKISDYLFFNNIKKSKIFILDSNVRLHFSTGYTSMNTVKNILQEGLKCYEANGFHKETKYTEESNYVVDTWQINSIIPYSLFAKDSPKFMTGFDPDKKSMDKSYTPPYYLKDHNENYIDYLKESLIFGFNQLSKRDNLQLQRRALSNIGFIINAKDFDENINALDIYANLSLQREFCGEIFANNSTPKGKFFINVLEDGKYKIAGRYGVASYLYGIPSKYIMGIIAPYGLLYSDEMCTELFQSGLENKCVVSPQGKILYTPNEKLNSQENLQEFLKNKDEFLAEQDADYKGYVVTRNVINYHESRWSNIGNTVCEEMQTD